MTQISYRAIHMGKIYKGSFVDLKKIRTISNLRVKFYWEQNIDYRLGDNLSDSSEKLLHRGHGEGQFICDFGERGRSVQLSIHFAEVSC